MEQLIIKIGGDMIKDMKDAYFNPAKREPGTHTLYLKNSEELYGMLSPKRLELLRHIIIHQLEKKTVSELAQELKRKQEAVSRDANRLAGYGLVEKTKEKQMVYLKALYGSLEIRLAGK